MTNLGILLLWPPFAVFPTHLFPSPTCSVVQFWWQLHRRVSVGCLRVRIRWPWSAHTSQSRLPLIICQGGRELSQTVTPCVCRHNLLHHILSPSAMVSMKGCLGTGAPEDRLRLLSRQQFSYCLASLPQFPSMEKDILPWYHKHTLIWLLQSSQNTATFSASTDSKGYCLASCFGTSGLLVGYEHYKVLGISQAVHHG